MNLAWVHRVRMRLSGNLKRLWSGCFDTRFPKQVPPETVARDSRVSRGERADWHTSGGGGGGGGYINTEGAERCNITDGATTVFNSIVSRYLQENIFATRDASCISEDSKWWRRSGVKHPRRGTRLKCVASRRWEPQKGSNEVKFGFYLRLLPCDRLNTVNHHICKSVYPQHNKCNGVLLALERC